MCCDRAYLCVTVLFSFVMRGGASLQGRRESRCLLRCSKHALDLPRRARRRFVEITANVDGKNSEDLQVERRDIPWGKSSQSLNLSMCTRVNPARKERWETPATCTILMSLPGCWRVAPYLPVGPV